MNNPFERIQGPMTLPPDPIQQQPTYDLAKAAFEAQKPIRVLFDNGAGRNPGWPYPGFERSYSSFPIPGTTARSWYAGPNLTVVAQNHSNSGCAGAPALVVSSRTRRRDRRAAGPRRRSSAE